MQLILSSRVPLVDFVIPRVLAYIRHLSFAFSIFAVLNFSCPKSLYPPQKILLFVSLKQKFLSVMFSGMPPFQTLCSCRLKIENLIDRSCDK